MHVRVQVVNGPIVEDWKEDWNIDDVTGVPKVPRCTCILPMLACHVTNYQLLGPSSLKYYCTFSAHCLVLMDIVARVPRYQLPITRAVITKILLYVFRSLSSVDGYCRLYAWWRPAVQAVQSIDIVASSAHCLVLMDIVVCTHGGALRYRLFSPSV
jgi:hypothetical protein